jgi:hypothetical protein
MNILATVNFGQRQITQSWEYLEGEPSPYLLLMKLENGDLLAINLESRFEKEIEGQKIYLATLDVSDAIVVTPTPE